jgi:tRNA(Ile2) C34 agmatinyltransferase TiaS
MNPSEVVNNPKPLECKKCHKPCDVTHKSAGEVIGWDCTRCGKSYSAFRVR